MALYNYFVTAPYAVLAIQMVMLFIYNGLALSILYTLTIKAQELSVTRKNEEVKVTVYSQPEKRDLPPPPVMIADKMFEIIRGITHLDSDKGEMPLTLGLRNDQVDFQVTVRRSEDEESMNLLFPEL